MFGVIGLFGLFVVLLGVVYRRESSSFLFGCVAACWAVSFLSLSLNESVFRPQQKKNNIAYGNLKLQTKAKLMNL